MNRFKGEEPIESDLPFKLPRVTNEIAEAMSDFGDRCVMENNRVPSATELGFYMLKYGAQDLQLTLDARERINAEIYA